MKKLISCIAACAGLVAMENVMAGEYCWNDKVTQLILKHEGVFFMTQKTCNSWCQVDPSWGAERINQVYSMLLASKISDRNITFFWNEHAGGSPCQNFVPLNAKPGVILLN
jgi:hypothetical protein